MVPLTLRELREATAKSLVAYFEGALSVDSTGAGTVLTIPSIADVAFDAERFQFWFAWRKADEWRLVTTTGLPAATTLTVQRAFDSTVVAGEVVKFYLILTPEEWTDACKDAIADKFYKDRFAVALSETDTEYDLTAVAPWLQTKGQILRVRMRREATSGQPTETDVPSTYVAEHDYGLKLIIPRAATSLLTENAVIIVEARHYYELESENDTITLPRGLAIAAAKHEALKKIFTKMGPGAKRIYGQQMVLTNQDLTEQEGRWLDNVAVRDWSDEEYPIAGDIERGMQWGW